MPREITYSIEKILDLAMNQFWYHGYSSTSMSDLVNVMKVSRAAIYSNFKNKDELFLACLDRYREQVVSPAFIVVEDCDADLSSIRRYFNFQIGAAEEAGLPGPGCMYANSMTETAPHNSKVQTRVAAHNKRLIHGFRNALANTDKNSVLKPSELDNLAELLATSAQGLWSYSRAVSNAEPLYNYVNSLLALIQYRVSHRK